MLVFSDPPEGEINWISNFFMVDKAKNEHLAATGSLKPVFYGLALNLISKLSPRSQEIIKKRFGLIKERGETLEKIGNDYDITRERVRQIVTDALLTISGDQENSILEKAEEKIIFTINKNNGIIKEEKIVENFNRDGFLEANAIRFIAECSKKIQIVEEKGVISRSWVLFREKLNEVKKINEIVLDIFSKEKELLTDGEITEKIKEKAEKLSREEILDCLETLEKIQKNKFEKWGLRNWMEVNPKGTREKIYLILKEEKKPLHFSEIAELIDKYKLGKRKAHPQTVHNELIKDNRFVLIGRGIYAMREWGYQEGTIKDVLRDILKRNEKPMKREDILEKVLKIRKVKKTTVMINLNNSREFLKQGDLYSLKIR